jgi:hypothetical protein
MVRPAVDAGSGRAVERFWRDSLEGAGHAGGRHLLDADCPGADVVEDESPTGGIVDPSSDLDLATVRPQTLNSATKHATSNTSNRYSAESRTIPTHSLVDAKRHHRFFLWRHSMGLCESDHGARIPSATAAFQVSGRVRPRSDLSALAGSSTTWRYCTILT